MITFRHSRVEISFPHPPVAGGQTPSGSIEGIPLKYKVYQIIQSKQYHHFLLYQSIIIMEPDQALMFNILKKISHKNQGKRNEGKLELQKYVYLLPSNKEDEVNNIIIIFYQQFLRSSDINKKIVGVDAMFIILSAIHNKPSALDRYESILINYILNCLRDSQAKIREMTFKKIYELIQLFQEDSMRFFNRIFQKLIGCINDTEQVVKTACQFVDKKLKDLFQKNCNREQYNIKEFVEILKSKIKTINLQVRRYLIKWIEIMLDQDLIVYLAQFLEDLLYMISDKEIQNSVYECLYSFELAINQKFEDKSLEQSVSIAYINEIFTILIKVANSKCQSYTKLKVLEWLKLFFLFFRYQVENRSPKINQKFYFKKIVIQRFDEILQPILLLMSHQEEEVRQESRNVNEILMQSVKKVDKSEPINIIKIVPLLKQALSQKKASNTSQHAINWMKFMFENYEGKIIPGMKEIVQKVMEKIYEGNAKNIHQIIEIMKSKEDYFELMIQKILLFLHTKIGESQDKIEPMLKKFINAEDIGILWTTICKYIDKYEHQSLFMYEVAASLNSIVVSQPKLLRVRKFLHEWDAPNYEFYFKKMFRILKYNPSAVISLCLLSNQYELAYKITKTLTGKYEITSKVLLGLCKMVSQLQSPAFVLLRMQIMQKQDYYLLQCLNSLLMILPQGKMFNMLRNRLDSSGIIPKSDKIVTFKLQNQRNPLQIEELFQEYKAVYGIK